LQSTSNAQRNWSLSSLVQRAFAFLSLEKWVKSVEIFVSYKLDVVVHEILSEGDSQKGMLMGE